MSGTHRNNSNSIELSCVIPLFNEESNVDPLLDELLPVLRNLGRSFEIIAVDDGSTDATADRLLLRPESSDCLRLIRAPRNEGQSSAFARGFRAARGALIVTLDGDLQIDPEDIPLMLAEQKVRAVDFVFGWRRQRRDPWHKRLSTRIANTVRNFLLGERIHDTGCPLKVFRREVLATLPFFEGMHRFYISLAHHRGWRSAEMVVRHRPRHSGTSKYGIGNRVFRSLRDCLAVRWMRSRHLEGTLMRTPESEIEASSPAAGEALMFGSANPQDGSDSRRQRTSPTGD